ncbi:VOC family protein, partial [Streptomyces sp. H27-D2]|uniref:VOC family protein n=1 Tax=Streptomyces sp. H27-D2 TaxID=3046304 RepID=UPI002DB9AC4F
VAAGYTGHKQPWDAFWGQRYASVQDPDGNTVDLFAALPADPAGSGGASSAG